VDKGQSPSTEGEVPMQRLLHIVPFCEGPNKTLKVLRKKNKKPEGFAKEKKFAKFAMQNASQLAAHHSLQI
jgi:hypothetical protein